ncbi:hypothetical protein IHE61_31130 [Streptomyces sp. GKU 257-1]|nr:hypothetical protein [Streptomyces sp. GKU 257-1]
MSVTLTVPAVPDGHHPAACWRRVLHTLDPGQSGGWAVSGPWLQAGDTITVPDGALILAVDKTTTGWDTNYRTGESYPVQDANVTAYLARPDGPVKVWNRHFKAAKSAFGSASLKKLSRLLDQYPAPGGGRRRRQGSPPPQRQGRKLPLVRGLRPRPLRPRDRARRGRPARALGDLPPPPDHQRHPLHAVRRHGQCPGRPPVLRPGGRGTVGDPTPPRNALHPVHAPLLGGDAAAARGRTRSRTQASGAAGTAAPQASGAEAAAGGGRARRTRGGTGAHQGPDCHVHHLARAV